MRFAQTVIPDPILIRLKREEQSLDTIKQFYVSYKIQLYSSSKVMRHYQLLHSMKGLLCSSEFYTSFSKICEILNLSYQQSEHYFIDGSTEQS